MTWGIWWIFTQPLKSPKISLQWAIFVQSIWGLSLKRKRGVISHGTEQWCKIWETLILVSKMAWRIGWTFIIRAPKSLKIVRWWALFVQGIYCFGSKLSEDLCVMTLKGVAKFKWKLTCGLKSDIRNLVNFYASSWKSKKWHFDWIRLSKVYKYLDEKVQKSYVSWNWRVM